MRPPRPSVDRFGPRTGFARFTHTCERLGITRQMAPPSREVPAAGVDLPLDRTLEALLAQADGARWSSPGLFSLHMLPVEGDDSIARLHRIGRDHADERKPPFFPLRDSLLFGRRYRRSRRPPARRHRGRDVSARIRRFVTTDLVQRDDGASRVVEVVDGQASGVGEGARAHGGTGPSPAPLAERFLRSVQRGRRVHANERERPTDRRRAALRPRILAPTLALGCARWCDAPGSGAARLSR